MVFAWISGGAAALGLTFAVAAAEAATVTDATFDLSGSYAYAGGKYGFAGDFSGSLLGDPTVERDYDLGVAVSLQGTTVFDETLSFGREFSISDAIAGLVSTPGFGGLLGALSSVTSDVSVGATSIEGDFGFGLDWGTSTLVRLASCLSLFASGQHCAKTGTFAIALDLSYEAPDAAPVPLPAGLPLLGAGLGALALLRRKA